MAELVEVTVHNTPRPYGLHTAVVAQTTDTGLVLTIPATNGNVVVRLNSSDVTELLNTVQNASSDNGLPDHVEVEQVNELDSVD